MSSTSLSSFRVITLSHKTAQVAIREQVALDKKDIKEMLQILGSHLEISNMLIVSTCNRTEIYYCAPKDLSHFILEALCKQRGLSEGTAAYLAQFILIKQAEEAVLHLLRVSAGLESREVGDVQIYSQLKQAYEYSVEEGMAQTFLHRVMHTVFFAHKRIIKETSFWHGTASVAKATVELVDLFKQTHQKPTILVIGAGEMGNQVCQYLSEMPNVWVQLINRTFEKTRALSRIYGCECLPFEKLGEAIKSADIVISCVVSDKPLITKKQLSNKTRLQYQYFIDLGVPRSIESSLEDLPGVILYNIDELQSQTSQVLLKRMQAVPEVEDILAQSLSELQEWTNEQVMSSAIGQLKQVLEFIRQEEIARFAKKMPEKEMQVADELTRSIIQKIITLPVLQLKAACKRGEADTLIKVLDEIFHLPKAA